MDNKNLGDQGRELLDDIMSGDFSQLNDKVKNFSQSAIDEFNKATMDIQGKVQPAIDEGKKQVRKGMEQAQKSIQQAEKQVQESFMKAQKQARDTYGGAYKKELKVKSGPKARKTRVLNEETPMALPKVRRSSAGTALVATGGAGVSLSLAAAITLGSIWFATGMTIEPLSILTIVFGVMALVNFYLISIGMRKRKFYRSYEHYYSLIGKEGFCEIKALAGKLGCSKRKVIKDLRKMVAKGFFPEGHFDEKKILFIGNDELFEQYMNARKGYEERVWEEKLAKKKEDEQVREATGAQVVNEELEKALQEGQDILAHLDYTKQGIYNATVVRKIEDLEVRITKIFSCVEKRPEKLSEIHKFMEYYLPITVKIVNAYKEFEAQPIQGDNISKSKKEIEDTLDTIIVAFEKLLDSLYEGEAMEVSSDISVLHALFAQEGLTKKDFDI